MTYHTNNYNNKLNLLTMKRKHFIIALMAMLSCFAFTAKAQNVAKVGNTEYATIDEAISAWTNGTTLTLLKDVTLKDVIKLNSNEKHTLDLGTFTMTAASGKDAFQYVVKGCTSDVGLSIKADETNPGGINAPGKAIIRHTKPLLNAPTKDRPYTQFYGGVFSASYIVYQGSNTGLTTGYTGASAPRFVFHGGEFNGTIYANRSKFIFNGGTFNGSIQISVDSSADALVKGGKFKNLSNLFGSALNTDKFTIGSAAGVYDRGIYVDKDGYYVVTSKVITEVSAKYPAVKKESYNSNNYFYYSAAAENGMFYEVASMAGTGSNVTVYEHAEVVEELDNNAAVKDFTPALPSEVVTFEVEAIDIEATAEATTKVTFNVEPKDASGAKVSNPSEAITFRLPVPAAWSGNANVYHEGTLLGAYTIKEENGAKYVEVSSANFSEFAVEAIVPLFAGEGTEASPYIIDSADKLAALSNSVNGGEAYAGVYFKLTSDITLSGEWAPIGNGSRSSKSYTGNAFKGVFDGGNNTISGLTITSTTGKDAAIGLFGVVDGGTVKNLNLEVSINVATSDLAGGVIGMMLNGATADAITVSGAVVGHDGVGGIVGRLIIDGTIANCTNNASVTSNYGGIGGIVGKAYYEDGSNTATFASITNCTNKGTIKAPMYVAGIAGLARANVSGCVNEGAIVGGTQTGGIVGQLMAAGTVSGNENKAKVSGTSHVGGIIGDYTQSGSYTYNNVSIANNTNRGEIAATGDCAAILGCNNVDGFTAMTATGNQSFYYVEGLELFGNPEDMVIDATNKFVVPVAQVGAETFYTLAEAIAAAQAGSEIKLLADATVEGTLSLPAGIKLTSNGHTINGSIRMLGDLTLNGPLTITGGLWVGKSGETLTATLSGDKLTAGYFMFQRGTYTINADIDAVYGYLSYEGTFEVNSTIHTTGANGEVLYINGNVTLNDGAVLDSDNSVFVCNDNAVLTLKPGSKVDSNVSITKSGAKLNIDATGMAAGASANITGTVTNSGNGTIAVVGNDNLEASIVNGKVVLAAKPVAKIGETYYATLAKAIAAATAGQTITLAADVTEDVTLSKAVTIDGTGKTYTGAMTLKADATFKNVNFDGKGYNGYAITTRGAQYLTIDGGSAKNYGYGFVQLASATVLTTVKNVTVSNMNYGVKVDYSGAVVLDSVDITAGVAAVLNSNYGEKTITIKNSKLNILGTWERNNTTKTTYAFEGANTVDKFVTVDAIDVFKLAAAGTTLTAPEGKTVTTDVKYNRVVYADGKYALELCPARIGEQGYATLQEAINAVQNGQEVVLLKDCAENVTLTEKVGLYYTINGDGKTLNGKITITPLSDERDNRRITIKNIKFENTADVARDFISCAVTNHYPRLTVEGCTFTGNGKNTDVALRLKTAYGAVIKNCTGTGLHSFLQNTAGKNFTIENVNVTNSKSGFALGTVQGVTVKGANIDVAGYGIRMDAQYNNNAVIESNTVKAFIPVVVRKAEVNSDVTVKGENTMTATNTDGIWFAAGTSEYETNGTMPTAATGKVKVTLEDKKLDLNGVYGNYGVASIGNAKFNTLAEAVNAAQAGSEIKLLADVTLAGGYEDVAEGLRIEKEITLNGNGYTINCGNFQKGIRVYNPSNVGDFNVNFNNVKVVNNVANGRCIDTRSGNINLKVNSSTLIATNGNSQPLTIGGNDPVHRVTLNKTTINAGASGYAVISFVSTNVDINGANNSTISGFAAFYLKGDAKTTNLNLGQGIYTGTNNHAVESGVFGTIVLEGDNNVVNLMGTNATVKAVAENTAPQAAFLVRGANNTIKITKESAKIITEGNAYEAMVDAGNSATTKFVDMGIERKLVAENRGYQFYSFEEAVRFAGNEGTIKIVNDFELAEAWTVAAGQNITLDLNGKTVTMVYNQKATKNHTMISNSGNLTIQSSVEGGKLSYTYAGENLGTTYSANTVTSNPGSVLTVKSGTIENLTYDSGIIAYAIDGLTNGGAGDVTVNIEGGVITSKRQALRIFANSTTNTGALNISGGDFTGRVIVQNANANANKAALNITGGTFNANEYKTDVLYLGGSQSATIDINATVSGGTFKGEITETHVTGFISGGTFVNPVAPEFCAAGFMPNKNTDGTYGVVVASGMVATTNGFGYATLAEAIKACVAGDNTITLLADCAEKVTITQVNGTNITINGNGKTYTGTITIKGDKVANNLYNTETLTFKNINFAPAYNTYAITAEKNTYVRNITVDGCTFKGNNDVYGIRVRNGYNYTVKNTTVEGVYTFFNASEALNGLTVENVAVKCANVAFSGAYGYGNASFKNVTVESDNNGVKVNNPNGSVLTFEGCSITAKAPVTFIENAGVTSALTAEFNGTNTMVANNGGTHWFNIVEADATDATFKAIVNDANLDMSNTAFVASVGNVYYSSLQKAINAAVDGDVVTLAKNIELDAANCVTNSGGYSVFVNVAGKAVTIDLNGKAVTANLSASQFASAKSKLLMAVFSVDTNGNLTLNDTKGTGKVAVTANDASVYSLISNYDSSAKLTINGGSYWLDKARAASSLIHSDPSEAVVVNGGNFYLGNVNTGTNGSPWIFNVNGNNTGHVIVNGGTFNYDINHQYWAFEVHVDKALTLKNNGDGTWTVVPAVAYVAEENNGYTRETGYETLKEAMSSKYGNEVTLLVDVDTTEVILIDKSLTINGNGHKVASSATRVFRVTTGDTEVTLNGVSMVSNAVRVGTNDIRGISIDIVNNVKLTLNNSSVDFTDASANDWAYALNVTGGENHVVTVNGGTYEGANVINVRGANNAVTVKDATLTSTYPNNDQYFGACIWVLQNQNSSVEATGNTFNGSNAIAFNLGTGTALTESENIDNTKMIVAKVDSEYYTSLAEAVAAADGNTVKILHSFDTDETATVYGDVTLDLNGKTITGTPSEAKAYAVITNKGTLTITGNGTVLCDHKLAGSTGYAVNTITNLGTLNIEDGVTIENKSTAQHQIGYAIDNNSTSTDAVVNIYGGKVTASGSLYYDGIRQFCNSETKENSVVVEGGEVSTIWMQNPSDGATKNTKDVKGSIAISGGNVGVLSLEPSASFEADVTGGYVGEISYFQTAAGRDLVEFVTDGTFGTKIDEAFLALGYQLTGNAAPYGVKYTGKREALTIDVAEYKDEYKNTQKLSVKTLTFKRKLNAGAWNAFFVPFEVPLSALMENYDVAYLNDASFYDRDENGSIEEITVQYVKFTEAHKDKKLFANHPYRIRPKNATVANMNLVLTDVELQTTERDNRKVLRCGGVYTNIEWHGLYERSYATDFLDGNNANDMCFAENSKGTFQNIGEYSVAPFRVMMVMTNSDEMPYTFDEEALANVRAITLGEDEFDATGIINIGSDQENSDLIFDLQGRRVLNPVKGNLYIINGKKVVY